MLKTILQNLSHSATFASLNSQSSKKTTWMQPQYSHLLPWATLASQRVAAHIALLLPRAASWAKVQQTVSEKGQKISGFVGSNCTLKRTNYPIVSCSVNSTKTWELLHCWHVGRSWMTANDPSSPEARVIDPHQWERQQGGMWKLGRNVAYRRKFRWETSDIRTTSQ